MNIFILKKSFTHEKYVNNNESKEEEKKVRKREISLYISLFYQSSKSLERC